MTSQIQLEQIRAQETEVRWQHEEDVDECPRCKRAFPHGTSKRKVSARDVTHPTVAAASERSRTAPASAR